MNLEGETPLTKTQKIIRLANIATVNVFAMLSYSLITAFFPREALMRGVPETVIGIIFGEYEFIVLTTSPIFGLFLSRIGARFMYISGLFLSGSGSILMGCLKTCPPGITFILMCLLVRGVQSVGASMTLTSGFAIMADTFPNNVATVFGALEVFIGLGLMLGPVIGGGLFDLGGYSAPFITTGCCQILISIGTYLSLSYKPSELIPQTGRSQLRLIIVRPRFWLTVLNTLGSCFCLGFRHPLFQPFLFQTFHLSSFYCGLVFLATPTAYAIFAPMWGLIVDKYIHTREVICAGMILTGVAYLFLNPSPLVFITGHYLFMTIISAFLIGMGTSAALVPVVKELLIITQLVGLPNNIQTYSMVSGLCNSWIAFGFFLGPVMGSIINMELGFAWSTTVVSFVAFIVAGITLIVIIIERVKTIKSINTTLVEKPECSTNLINNESRTLILEPQKF